MLSESHQIRRRDMLGLFGRGAVVAMGTSLLAACDNPSASRSARALLQNAASSAQATTAADDDEVLLNFALALEYVAAQYYALASTGLSLPSDLVAGTGRQGVVSGGTRIPFVDASLADQAAHLASDKRDHVVSLRETLKGAAAAQGSILFTARSDSPFSLAAQASGIAPAGAVFDPFAGDEPFLLGAFMIEDVMAASYRALQPRLRNVDYGSSAALLLADSVYHQGVVRTLLRERSDSNPALAKKIAGFASYLATATGSGSSPDGGDSASDLVDEHGDLIPYIRTPDQVWRIASTYRS